MNTSSSAGAAGPAGTGDQNGAQDKAARITEKVRKLLRLAGDPRTPDEERQTAYAMAADMMTRHNIDAAMVREQRGEGPEPIEVYRFVVSARGGHGKARVLAASTVAEALGCQCALYYEGRRTARDDCDVVIVGAASDVTTARTLLPLVLTQAEHAAARAARDYLEDRREQLPEWVYERGFLRWERTKFYRSFLTGYADQVAHRISRRRRQLVEEAASTGSGADLVLVNRADRVAVEFSRLFPKLGKVRAGQSNDAGYRSGQVAGRHADLGDGQVSGAGRPALPSAP